MIALVLRLGRWFIERHFPEFAREIADLVEVMPHLGLVALFALERFEFELLRIQVQGR